MSRPVIKKKRRKPLIIVFAGPEGAGKSTHQKFIVDHLATCGLRSAAARGDRLTCGHAARKLCDCLKKQKHAPRQYLTEYIPQASTTDVRTKAAGKTWKIRARAARRGMFYILDSLIFRWYVRSRRDVDVLVFDRSGYDNLAKVIEYTPTLTKFIRKMSVRPDLVLLLSANPDDLVRRRPRSSRAYYDMVMRRYAALVQICPELVQIPICDLKKAQRCVREHVEQVLARQI